MDSTLRQFWARHGGWVMVGAIVVVIVLAALSARAAMLTRMEPGWWSTVDPDDPQVVQTAQSFENGIINHLNKRRESDPDAANGGSEWDVYMESEHANAWLTSRLPAWLAAEEEFGEWPDEVSEVQVSFGDPYIRIGARLTKNGREQVVSATLVPEMREDNSLWLVAKWVHIGRLAIPGEWVLSEAEARADDILPPAFREAPEGEAIFRAFAGREPMAEDPTVKLPDGREVRLVALQAQDGLLYFRWRTEYQQ